MDVISSPLNSRSITSKDSEIPESEFIATALGLDFGLVNTFDLEQ